MTLKQDFLSTVNITTVCLSSILFTICSLAWIQTIQHVQHHFTRSRVPVEKHALNKDIVSIQDFKTLVTLLHSTTSMNRMVSYQAFNHNFTSSDTLETLNKCAMMKSNFGQGQQLAGSFSKNVAKIHHQ